MPDKKVLYREDVENQIKQSENDLQKLKTSIENQITALRQTEAILMYAKNLLENHDLPTKPEEKSNELSPLAE